MKRKTLIAVLVLSGMFAVWWWGQTGRYILYTGQCRAMWTGPDAHPYQRPYQGLFLLDTRTGHIREFTLTVDASSPDNLKYGVKWIDIAETGEGESQQQPEQKHKQDAGDAWNQAYNNAFTNVYGWNPDSAHNASQTPTSPSDHESVTP